MKLTLSSKMTNAEVAQLFTFIAKVLILEKSNLFRSRAYDEAAEVVAHLPYQLADVFSTMKPDEFEEKMNALPGIGKAITARLLELYSAGDIPFLQELVHPLPGGVWSLTQVHGIGAKKAVKLAEQFKLDDPDTAVKTLLTLAKEGKLRELDGFGVKSEQQIIEQLEEVRTKGRIPRDIALRVADRIKETLEKSGDVAEVLYLGSLRRGEATVGDIDIGVATQSPETVGTYVSTNLQGLTRVIGKGDKTMRILLTDGYQADIKFAPPSEWGSFLQYFTGNKQHNIGLREIALKLGLSLSEHGIKNVEKGEMQVYADEKEFYRAVGYQWVPPEERVGNEEFKKYKL